MPRFAQNGVGILRFKTVVKWQDSPPRKLTHPERRSRHPGEGFTQDSGCLLRVPALLLTSCMTFGEFLSPSPLTSSAAKHRLSHRAETRIR